MTRVPPAVTASDGVRVPHQRVRRAWWRGTAVVLSLSVLAGACTSSTGDDSAGPTTEAVSDEALAQQGGVGTIQLDGREAFAQPLPGLTSEQRRTFAVGNSFFNQNWVTAPASTTGRDGLGPLFNAQSCSSCHFKDGRGRPPLDPDDAERGLLLRLSVEGEDGTVEPHPIYGGQFQDRAVRDLDPEGSFTVNTTERTGAYPDGAEWSLAVPGYTLVDADGQPIEDLVVSPRVAPAMIGLGLLEAIPDETLVAAADPDDADGDGISGRVNRVDDPASGQEVIGRFGWKAAVPSVRAQTADAFANDIGITSSLQPNQPCTDRQPECAAAPDGGDPDLELDDEKLDQVTFYSRTLAVPARREVAEPSTREGQDRFASIGCASCHTPEFTTGSDELDSLADQVIRPYSDLLVHDMGPDLADDRPDGDATGQEWRTPPLWGIGLVETVNRHTRFLHDGRARNLEEAVLWHGGEAEAARDRFVELSAPERQSVLTFLESL